jgi:hypothetical protein
MTVALADTVALYRASPQQVAVTVEVALVPPSWPYWLGGFALLAAALAAFALGQRWVQSRKLFGQLEAWPQGRPQEVSRFPDLSTFGHEAAIGSEQIVLRGADRRFGTLCVKNIEGARHVVVKPATGERIVHDGRTQIELPLFDADSFELGGWVFRYRGEVERRHARGQA